MSVDLSVALGPLSLKNPVLAASGIVGFGTEYAGLMRYEALGGFVTKGLSPRARTGNPPGRICETASGMLNAIGLENPGVDVFLAEKVPAIAALDTRVVVNVFGTTEEEYAEVCARLESCARVDAFEINISCPNVKAGGLSFGRDPAAAAAVMRRVRAATRKPVWVKLSPNVGDIGAMAQAVEGEGADAVSLVNSITGLAIDIRTRRSKLSHGVGGLTGPAIKPVAVRMVWEAAHAVRIPVVGLGGISTWEDAVEFLLAGARAVQVGTAIFADPRTPERIVEGLRAFLEREGCRCVGEIVGTALVGG